MGWDKGNSHLTTLIAKAHASINCYLELEAGWFEVREGCHPGLCPFFFLSFLFPSHPLNGSTCYVVELLDCKEASAQASRPPQELRSDVKTDEWPRRFDDEADFAPQPSFETLVSGTGTRHFKLIIEQVSAFMFNLVPLLIMISFFTAVHGRILDHGPCGEVAWPGFNLFPAVCIKRSHESLHREEGDPGP